MGVGGSSKHMFGSLPTISFFVYCLHYHSRKVIYKNLLQKYFCISIGIFHPLRRRNQIIKMLNYESASLIKGCDDVRRCRSKQFASCSGRQKVPEQHSGS